MVHSIVIFLLLIFICVDSKDNTILCYFIVCHGMLFYDKSFNLLVFLCNCYLLYVCCFNF